MTQEPHKSNIVLIVIAIIGVLGTAIGAIITVIGNYNVEKFRAESELTRIALVSMVTQGVGTQVSMASTISAPTNKLLPTNTLLPTNSPLPTNTSLPTKTPYPTNTPKPSISLPFSDDFSSGINPPWYAYSGKWMTTSSGATITITDNDGPTGALILDDPTLTNFRVRVNVHSPHVLSACQGDLGVVVRYQPERDQNLIFFMNSASRFYWGYTSSLNPDFGSVLPVTDVDKGNIISDFTMELDVSGNTFTARVNGEKYDSFSLAGYETGGVVLIPVCGCVGSCPSFSNFSLEPLP